jgi:hypothetical protein
LKRQALDPEKRSKAMKLIGIVGQEMAPPAPRTPPNRLVDVDSHSEPSFRAA